MNSPEAPQPLSWQLQSQPDRHTLVIAGDWNAQTCAIPQFAQSALAGVAKGQTVTFDAEKLGTWDSGLVEFLWDVKRVAAAASISVDAAALPESARKLLMLLSGATTVTPKKVRARTHPVEWLGSKTIALVTELGVAAELFWTLLIGSGAALVGRTHMRRVDLLSNVQDAGPSALLIVTVVNLLLGAILAFVGAAELRRFAAGTYVADLVGIALVRELAAVVTAIVMAGRTGGAYAARLATMRGNEELDALQVIGIPLPGYLLLPAVLALLLTMPLLYFYACLVGMVGGFIVSYSMLNVTAAGYFHETVAAVHVDQFAFGCIKTIAFAVLIGIASCRIGLQAGRSSADVGTAATRAVVTGIVGIIALDAVFAVIANAIDI